MTKFIKFFVSLGLVANFGIANQSISEEKDEIDLDTLEVSAKKLKDDEKAYKKAGAVSSREGIGETTQSLDSVVRSMSGTYTNTDQSQGTIQVNIRSMTGLGRVNTMIDGVTQTYYGSSADQKSKYHTDGAGRQAFGAMIDPMFLVGVDVEKGTFSGGHGGLMGSANFRTISVDDLVRSGNFGAMLRAKIGTNGLNYHIMGSVGATHSFENGLKIGALVAYSAKEHDQKYKAGGGGVMLMNKLIQVQTIQLIPTIIHQLPLLIHKNLFNAQKAI